MAQLGYLVDGLAVLGVTLLPYSASMDRYEGQPACHGRGAGIRIYRSNEWSAQVDQGSICGPQH